MAKIRSECGMFSEKCQCLALFKHTEPIKSKLDRTYSYRVVLTDVTYHAIGAEIQANSLWKSFVPILPKSSGIAVDFWLMDQPGSTWLFHRCFLRSIWRQLDRIHVETFLQYLYHCQRNWLLERPMGFRFGCKEGLKIMTFLIHQLCDHPCTTKKHKINVAKFDKGQLWIHERLDILSVHWFEALSVIYIMHERDWSCLLIPSLSFNQYHFQELVENCQGPNG